MVWITTNSCKQNSEKSALEMYIQPYIKDNPQHLLIVPQVYYRSCINLLFTHVQNKNIKENTSILFLEVGGNFTLPEGIMTDKFSNYYAKIKNKNTNLIWVQLNHNKITNYQRLSSLQFHENLVRWIKN